MKARFKDGAFIVDGNTKKIFISQQLLARFDTPEATATLLHEAGHAFISTLTLS